MDGGFTDFLLSLEGRQGSPSRESLDCVWQALRGALVHELKKRGLWHSPPSYLGVEGRSRWWQPTGGGSGSRDALDELVGDCYTYVFLLRLRSLRAQLQAKDNVDGLVFLAIRNFVHDRQKENDPEGYRVFDLARLAVRSLLAQEILFVWRPSPSPSPGGTRRDAPHVRGVTLIHQETVLTFRPQEEPALADSERLRGLIQIWNDDLLPDIVTARYQEKRRVQQELECHIARLPQAGVLAFRFQDLVSPFKTDVRTRWRLLVSRCHEQVGREGDGSSDIALADGPDRRLVERDSFEKLAAGVAGAIDASPKLDSRTRAYLSRLWRGLTRYASGQGPGEGNGRPSNRMLARSLGIPRDRLPALLRALRDPVRQYQADASSRQSAVRSVDSTTPSTPSEGPS